MSQSSTTSTSSSNYRSIFDNALEAYKKKTRSDLALHPLLTKLESCDSPEAVLTMLRGEILGFDQARSTTWLISTVKVLDALSSTIGGGVGLVSLK
jgi:hypothetical protein